MGKLSFSEKQRVSRIKTLIKCEGIKQKDLAEKIGVEPQNLSRDMVNNKVSDKTCRKIAEAFPEYRLEWLLGFDDYMTDYEWADGIQNMKDLVADSMWGIIETSLQKQGKSLKFVHRRGQHVDSSERVRADCYYSVVDKEGNELKRLTAIEMIDFEQKIQEYCDFLSGKYLT